MEIQLLSDISRAIYAWALDNTAQNYIYFTNAHGGGYGMQWAFIILLAVSFLGVATYYWGIAAKAVNATKANYIWTFLLFLFALWVFDYSLIYTLTDMKDFFTWNMLKLNLVNSVYFVVLYELFSWFIKGSTHASNIDLMTCFK